MNSPLRADVSAGFAGSRGEIYGDDVAHGKPVKVRYIWNELDPDRARWEQALSYNNRSW